MLKQFQSVLLTPRPTPRVYLKRVQQSMLTALQNMFPSDYDFTELAKIFQQQSYAKSCTKQDKSVNFPQNPQQNMAELTYKLTEYFIKIINQNFINSYTYFALEEQTQKLQSMVRGHIKMEQQMKMYLQHLEYKVERYEFHFNRLKMWKMYENNGRNNQNNQNNINNHHKKQLNSHRKIHNNDYQRQNIDIDIERLKKKQTQLMKQRLGLLKKVEHLQRQLKDQQIQLRRLNSPVASSISKIKQTFVLRQSRLREQQGKTMTIINNNNNDFEFLDKSNNNNNNNNLQVQQQYLTSQYPSPSMDRRYSSYSLSLINNTNDIITQKKSSTTLLHPNSCLLRMKDYGNSLNNLNNNNNNNNILNNGNFGQKGQVKYNVLIRQVNGVLGN